MPGGAAALVNIIYCKLRDTLNADVVVNRTKFDEMQVVQSVKIYKPDGLIRQNFNGTGNWTWNMNDTMPKYRYRCS